MVTGAGQGGDKGYVNLTDGPLRGHRCPWRGSSFAVPGHSGCYVLVEREARVLAYQWVPDEVEP